MIFAGAWKKEPASSFKSSSFMSSASELFHWLVFRWVIFLLAFAKEQAIDRKSSRPGKKKRHGNCRVNRRRLHRFSAHRDVRIVQMDFPYRHGEVAENAERRQARQGANGQQDSA